MGCLVSKKVGGKCFACRQLQDSFWPTFFQYVDAGPALGRLGITAFASFLLRKSATRMPLLVEY